MSIAKCKVTNISAYCTNHMAKNKADIPSALNFILSAFMVTKTSEKRAERGARGKLEGVYLSVNDRKLPQRDAVRRRIHRSHKNSEMRARQGARGKLEGVY